MAPNPVVPWLVLGIPVAFVVVALGTFLVRWSQLQRRAKEDPEALLLGAVSTSLRERGDCAASLGDLRTLHERILEALPFGLLWVDAKQRIAGLNAEGRKAAERGPRRCRPGSGIRPRTLSVVAGELGPRCGPASRRCPGGGRRWRLRRIEVPDKMGALLEFEDITEAEAEEQRRQLRDRFAELGHSRRGRASIEERPGRAEGALPAAAEGRPRGNRAGNCSRRPKRTGTRGAGFPAVGQAARSAVPGPGSPGDGLRSPGGGPAAAIGPRSQPGPRG